MSNQYQHTFRAQALKNTIGLMRLDKPIGIFLLLWPTLIALWIAGQGAPSLGHVLIFSMGVILMRSAGCVINDFADRNFDGCVKRTMHRPLARQDISPRHALIVFATLNVSAFCLVCCLNPLTRWMSCPALFFAILYPFTKRFTRYPQFFLGVAFSWSIFMAFTAEMGQITGEAGLLFVATLLWVLAYDTQYAMVDKQDDLKIGIYSTAITFGRWDTRIILISQVASLILFAYLGMQLKFTFFYYLGLFIALMLCCYQQTLLYKRIPERCFKAFLNNNYFGAVIFLGLVLQYYYYYQ